MISVSGLTYSIGRAPILQDISLDIPAGQITALIGPNGAGKSTLLNMIARLERPRQGHVLLEGTDIWATDPRHLACRIALVAQSTSIASRLRIRDLVGFGRWPHHQGRPGREDHAMIQQALEAFELQDLSARFLDEVSGGQRQRAFVAMAYCQDTDWLLLDEPLNNLDLRHATALMGKLRQLADQGKSIVIVLHDLNYAVTWADRIVAMQDGRIVQSGTTAQVATSSILSQVFGTDVSVEQIGEKKFVRYFGSRPTAPIDASMIAYEA